MPSCKQDKSTALNATYEAEFADRLSDAHFIREVRLLYCSRCFGLFVDFTVVRYRQQRVFAVCAAGFGSAWLVGVASLT